MSESKDEKPFRPLKINSFKTPAEIDSAKPDSSSDAKAPAQPAFKLSFKSAASGSGEGSTESNPPAGFKADKAVSSQAPQAAGEGTASPPSALKLSFTPAASKSQETAAAQPGAAVKRPAGGSSSFNLISLKVEGPKKEDNEAPVEPPREAAASPSASATPAPKLSPPAAISGMTPAPSISAVGSKKPFKILESSSESGLSRKSAELKISKSAVEHIDLGKVPSAEPVAEPQSPSIFEKAASLPAAEVRSEPVPVNRKKNKAKFVVTLAAIFVFVAVGVTLSVSGSKVARTSPAVVAPVMPAAKPATLNTEAPKLPANLPEPAVVAHQVGAENGNENELAAPRMQKPELVEWLLSSKVTTIAAQRLTLNDKVYHLGTLVNPDGTLKWIGRDSVTKDLLFIDDSGVVYNKSTSGR